MKINIAKLKDIPALSEIYTNIIKINPYYSQWAKKSELKRFNPKSIGEDMANKDNLYILMKDKNKIIGASNGYYEAGLFWIDWLVVNYNYRRKGLALKLIRYFENKLNKENIHKVWCDSRTTNIESESLLTKLGYKKLVTIKNHWYKQDFILWQKIL